MALLSNSKNVGLWLSVICFIQGVGMLFPWNTMLADNWEARVEGHSLQKYYLSIGLFSYLIFNGGVMVANMFLNCSEKFNRNFPYVGYGIYLLSFALMLMVVVNDFAMNTVFWTCLLIFILVGVATGIVQGNIFALISKVHFKYSSMVLIGQGISGILPPLVKIIMDLVAFITKPIQASQPTDAEKLAAALKAKETDRLIFTIFYSLALAVLALSLFAFSGLASCVDKIRIQERLEAESERNESGSEGNAIENSTAQNSSSTAEEGATAVAEEKPSVKVVLSAMYPFAIVLASTFGLSLMVFPAYFFNISRDNSGPAMQALYFTSVLLLFAIGDFLGRFMPQNIGKFFGFLRWVVGGCKGSMKPMTTTRYFRVATLLTITSLRWLIAPFILFMKTGRNPAMFPALIDAPAFALFIVFMLGLSTGACVTDAFIAAPSAKVKTVVKTESGETKIVTRDLTDAERSISGRILTIALIGGLILATSLSFAFLKIANVSD